MKNKKNLIIGTGGHARVVIDTLEHCKLKISGLLDLSYKNANEKILSYPVLGDYSTLLTFSKDEYNILIAIGDNKKRAEVYNFVTGNGYECPVLVHPSAIVSKKAKINSGVFINAGCIINAEAEIGENVIVNTGAIVEHEVKIGSHTHIGPSCKIAGRTVVGENVFLGIGSVIIDKIFIGDNVTVGAGSIIIKDIEENSVYAGIPGRKIN